MFIAKTADFLGALKMASNFVEGLGANNCIISTADVKDNIKITSHSGHCWLTNYVPAKITEKKKISTDSETLAGLRLSGKELEVSLEKSKLNFKSGRIKGSLDIKSPKDSQDCPHDFEASHKFDVKTFKSAIGSVSYDSDVIETVDVKPIRIRFVGKKLVIATNDKYCMSISALEHKPIKGFDVILPLNILSSAISYLDEDFYFGFSEKAVRIKCSSFDLVHNFVTPEFKMVEDHMEELKRVEDEKPKSLIELDTKKANEVLDELASFTDDLKDAKISIECNTDNKCKIYLKAHAGSANTSLKSDKVSTHIKFDVSLYLFKELVRKTNKRASIKVHEGCLLIQDKTNSYVLPLM